MKIFTQLTRALPFFRSHAYERMVVGLASGRIGSMVADRGLAALDGAPIPDRALVVADTNIGDAILLQPAIAALKQRFPACRVDYAFNRKMAELTGSDPELHAAHPIFSSGDDTTAANLDRLEGILHGATYDLIINFCPFFTGRHLDADGRVVIHPLGLAIALLRSIRSDTIAAMPFRVASWVNGIADRILGHAEGDDPPFPGTSVWIRAKRARRVAQMLDGMCGSGTDRAVFVNPDTSNYSTFAGAEVHAEIIRRLAGIDSIGPIILGRGFTYRGVEHEILAALESRVRDRVTLCPNEVDLEDFAALVDRCAVYVGGDTGPLHIAAARKLDPDGLTSFSNRLAVVALFKATEPRIYGYDTDRADMIDSSQDATAVTVEARPPCKNLTCSMQRISQSCPAVACQDELDVDAVVEAASAALAAFTDGTGAGPESETVAV
jgi:ADP-heptose:LPS heptosyltransferase